MLSDQEITQRTQAILRKNVVEDYSQILKHKYCYIKPARGVYPYQYWWDTCFHIFMLCALDDIELAKKNIESLFAVQEENGFVGHIIFWRNVLPGQYRDVLQARPTWQRIRPHTSALIQPPLVAQALKRIWEQTRDRDFLQQMLPKLIAYFDWLKRNRDFDHDNLISLITTFESGMDWSPVFDPVVGFRGQANRRLWWKVVSVDLRNFLRHYDLPAIYQAGYFQVKDVLFNTFYALDLNAMADLCLAIGDRESADRYGDLSKEVSDRIEAVMYDSGRHAFFNTEGEDNRKIPVITPTIFYPLALGVLPEEEARKIVTTHYLQKGEFSSAFPVPSVGINQPSFNPMESSYLWRGPSWVVHNWFLYRCLLTRGYDEEAAELLITVKKLISKSGFREYYNPFTGEGYGAYDFTWSGLVVDMMRMEKEDRA